MIFLISKHTHYSPLKTLQWCLTTFRLNFKCLTCLVRLFSISSSSLIFVTQLHIGPHTSANNSKHTRPVLLLGPGSPRSFCLEGVPSPVSLPADACSYVNTHLNHCFPTPRRDQAPWSSHRSLLQLQSHAIILEPKDPSANLGVLCGEECQILAGLQ